MSTPEYHVCAVDLDCTCILCGEVIPAYQQHINVINASGKGHDVCYGCSDDERRAALLEGGLELSEFERLREENRALVRTVEGLKRDLNISIDECNRLIILVDKLEREKGLKAT